MKPNKKLSNLDLCTNLIREVRIRPPLWNEKDENWMNGDLVCKLWNDVGTLIGIPGPVACTKWNNLRERYNCEFHKQISAAECNTDYKPKWALFDCMKFLNSSHSDPSSSLLLTNMDKNCQDPRMNKRHLFNQNVQNMGPPNGIVDLCEICKHSVQQHGISNNHNNNQGKMKISNDVKRLKPSRVCKEMRSLEEENNDHQDIKVYVQKKVKNASSSTSVCRHPDLVVALSQSKQSDCFTEEQNIVGSDLPEFCSEMPCSDDSERQEMTINRPIKLTHGKVEKIHNIQKSTKCHDKNETTLVKHDVECQNNGTLQPIDKNISPFCNEAVVKRECERKENPNCQFLLSLVPYLDQLGHVDCLEVRSQIQCLINDAYRRRQHGCSHMRRMRE